MADIKKTLLKKKVNGKVVGLYPQTSADIVSYGESSTVAAEIAAIISKLGDTDVSAQINAAVEQAKKDILGLDETNTKINEAYDTLREIAEWIENDESGAAAIAADVATLKSDLNTEGTGLKAKVTALETAVGDTNSGLVKDVAALKSTVGDSSAGLVKDVADNAEAISSLQSSATQVQVVSSDTADDALNDNDLYFVEIA
jgi:hypothetical protein